MTPPAHFGTVCRHDSPAVGEGRPSHNRGPGFSLALARITTVIVSSRAPGRGAAQAGRLKRDETLDEAKS